MVAPTAFAQNSIDLLINHDVVPTSATGPAGGDFSYQPIVVLNAGNQASNVQLTEKLPVGVILNSIDFAPAGSNSCSAPTLPVTITAANQSIVCNLDDITAPGVANGIRVEFNVTIPGVNTNWEALASATATETDGDPSNNKDLPRNITTYDAADLGIVLSAPATVTEFQPFDYTATVTSHGPSTVSGSVSVSFTVPNGISVNGAGGNGWTCTPNGGGSGTTLVCTHTGPVARGTTLADLTIPATASVTGQVDAAASVSGKTSGGAPFPDGQSANNTSSVNISVASDNVINLSMAKSVSPGTVDKDLSNNEVTFTLKATRASGSVAPTNVEITDTLPAGVTFTSFTQTAGWDCSGSSGNAIDCTFTGTTPSTGNAYPAIKFKSQVDGSAISATSVTNQATVGADNESAGQQGDNSASAEVKLSDTVNLSLNKTASKSPIKAGEAFDFKLGVKNTGALDVLPNQTMTLVDHVPAGIQITGYASTGSAWSCSPAAPQTGAVDITCTSDAGLVSGATSTVTLHAKGVFSGPDSYVHITNNASLTGVDGRTFSQVDDSATVNVSENTVDIGIAKSASPGTVQSGDTVTYTLTVTNHDSTNPSTGITVTDKLIDLVTSSDGCPLDSSGSCTAPGPWPNGGFQSASITSGGGSGDSCSASGNINNRTRTVTCHIATLAGGASASITIVARHYAADGANSTTVQNKATVNSSQVDDSNAANNSSTANVQVTPLTDLQVFKEPSPATAAVGEPVTYTVHVYNAGPSNAANVKLVDQLPANGRWIASGFAPGTATCTSPADATAGGTLSCSWTTQLKPNEQFAVTYQLRSDQDTDPSDTLDNSAKVSTDTTESNLNNNTATAQVDLKPAELDVLINMQHTHDGLVVANHEGTEYTITVTNNGPASYATDVKMVDEFPGVLQLGGQSYPSTATFSFQGLVSVSSSRSGSSAGMSDCTVPSINATSGPLTCLFDMMAPGETITIKFNMDAESLQNGQTGTIFHNASVQIHETEYLSNGSDTQANNFTTDRTSARATVDTPPAEVADLSLAKDADSEVSKDSAPLDSGDPLNFTLTVTNHGPDSSTTAVVHDTLPQGLMFVSAGPSCTWTEATRLVACQVGTLAVDASTSFTIQTTLANPYNGARPLVNTARVIGNGDPNDSNDSDDSTTKVAIPPYVAVPALDVWAMLALMLLLAGIAGRSWRRARR